MFGGDRRRKAVYGGRVAYCKKGGKLFRCQRFRGHDPSCGPLRQSRMVNFAQTKENFFALVGGSLHSKPLARIASSRPMATATVSPRRGQGRLAAIKQPRCIKRNILRDLFVPNAARLRYGAAVRDDALPSGLVLS